jgi:hypothetical protein
LKASQIVVLVLAGIIGFFIAFYIGASGYGNGSVTLICFAVAVGIPLVLLIRLYFINKPIQRASKGDEATAHSADPPAGSGALFVYRDQFVGRLVGTNLRVDDAAIGQLRGKTFYRLDLPAGEHVVSSGMADGKQGTVSVKLGAGERLYVRETFLMGMVKTSTDLGVVASSEGSRAIAKCHLLRAAAAAPAASLSFAH